jgi:hypothetical protein
VDEGAWTRFAAELSTQAGVIEVLMAAHGPTATGLCRACTTPGRGTPQKRWPCALWMLAAAARGMRAEPQRNGEGGSGRADSDPPTSR